MIFYGSIFSTTFEAKITINFIHNVIIYPFIGACLVNVSMKHCYFSIFYKTFKIKLKKLYTTILVKKDKKDKKDKGRLKRNKKLQKI